MKRLAPLRAQAFLSACLAAEAPSCFITSANASVGYCLDILKGNKTISSMRGLDTSHNYLFETGPGTSKTLVVYTSTGSISIDTQNLSCASARDGLMLEKKIAEILSLYASSMEYNKQAAEGDQSANTMTQSQIDATYAACGDIDNADIAKALKKLKTFSTARSLFQSLGTHNN